MRRRAPDNEALRHLLEDVAAGRIVVDEAVDELERIQAQASPPSSIVLNAPRRRRWSTAMVFIMLFAVTIGGVGGFFGWRTLRFELIGRTTEGRVIHMVHGGGSGNHMKPVVAYSVDGKDYEITGFISSSPPAWNIGEKAVVYYNPADPSDAQISGFIERWLFPLIFGSLGAVVGFVGLAILAAAR